MAEPVNDESLLKKAPSKKAPAKKAATKKAPTKKAAAKKAPTKKASKAAESATTRRKLGPSGWLQNAILEICLEYEDGKLDTGGKPLTPHRIAKLIGERGNPTPSSGAVAAALDRWKEYGFAKISEKPVAFKSRTAAGKKKGLETMVEEHRKAAWAARKSA